MRKTRELRDLISVGPTIERDFRRLGVRTVQQLATQDPNRLFVRLCRITGGQQDACVLDVFSAAVAQARDPFLPHQKCQWWYWSRQRKAHGKAI